VAIVVVKTTSYAIMNAMRWGLKDNKLGLYTYVALMMVDVVREYNIFAV
jgi:hypothetical protein